jgi:hypothetical protein
VTDTEAPKHSNEFPAPSGRTNDATPTISVWVFDNSWVNESSIKLYVNGYSVKTEKSLKSDGYKVYFNVSYTHEAGFANGQVVSCRITARDMLGNLLNYIWQFTVDLQAPQVTSVFPSDGSTDVPRNTTIIVLFSEPMDHASVESAFQLSPPASGYFTWSGNEMTYHLNTQLIPTTAYTASVGTGAKDIAGNNLPFVYDWVFTTEQSQIRIYHSAVDWAELGDAIPVQCIVSTLGGSTVSDCTLYLKAVGNSTYMPIPMALTGGTTLNGTWSGTIPPQASVGFAYYYIVAHDNLGATATHPESDPATSPHAIDIADTTSPSHANEQPQGGSTTSDLTPVISVDVTDLSALDTNLIALYVNGFEVEYTLTPIPGGYRVSYHQDRGFDNGPVQCRIYAGDVYFNLMDWSWSFTVNVPPTVFNIQLSAGWNLVSMPLVQADTSLGAVLSSIIGHYDRVMAYDPFNPQDHWRQYYNGWPEPMNDLRNLDHTMGFWIHMLNPATLTVSGPIPINTDILLLAGWNLVGYPAIEEGNYTVADLKADTGATIVEGFNSSATYLTSVLPDGYILKRGEGYWIYTPTDTVWPVANPIVQPQAGGGLDSTRAEPNEAQINEDAGQLDPGTMSNHRLSGGATDATIVLAIALMAVILLALRRRR